MLNIEKYKGEIECWYDSESANQCSKSYCLSKAIKEVYIDRCKDKSITMLEWLCEEYKEPILDEEERKYLSAVIKPFRNRIVSIAKIKDWIDENSNLEVVEIVLKLPNKYQGLEYVQLPYFEKDTMYKNMKANKRYTLEEVGL